MATDRQRQKILDALMQALADTPWQAIGFDRIAGGAGLTLAQVRGAYRDKASMLMDLATRVDQAVLAGDDPLMADEPVKDRLFDVLMRRFDVLTPWKPGLVGLMRSARRDPALALLLNAISVGSQHWMLAAARLDHAGPAGAVRAQVLSLGLLQVMQVWLEDDEPGLARTMARLDRMLGDLDRLARRVAPVEQALERLFGRLQGLRPGRATRDDTNARGRADADMPESGDGTRDGDGRTETDGERLH